MQGLILAAGMGKRLGKHTQEQTKCMIKVNGKTLIERMLDALLSIKITNVIMVVGYYGEKLQNFLGSDYKGIKITYVINENYDTTNNIYSLWLASQYLVSDDTLILESDLIFEERILKNIIDNPNKNLAVVAKYEPWMDGTVTLVDENDKILNFISKKYFDWSQTENYFKTVNIYKFSKEFSTNCYMPFLDAYVKTMGKNEYYEQVLKVLTYLENIDLKAHKLTHEKWYEIDDVQDLDIAEVLFADQQNELEYFQKRFGGYWRFQKLKDFCYLVNPYFPNERFLNELKASFEMLISQYPSGLNVQNLLAAKMFGCDPSEILVGNGASELIKGLVQNLSGTIGIIFPTFNEYPERIGLNRIKKFIPQNKDFTYTINEIKEFSQDIKALVLINPDNPSGNLIPKNDVLELLGYLQTKGIVLVLDESFIDFAGKDNSYTLINSDLMQQYQNLVVIKSISKSYGVPGLRLGVLASGDSGLIANVRRELSIWNINSLGEYFLQIFGKYKNDYEKACHLIALERNRFFTALNTISFLRVIPSYANYFLCEVSSKITSTELAKILLSKYHILIKDCNGKVGFADGNYIRIAVRDFDDNNYLVQCLTELDFAMPHPSKGFQAKASGIESA
ncbi:MAG: aminotransferase class I/II-fold pyridoxal phosphate-dependent enzyme [Bacteroidota bacterium]